MTTLPEQTMRHALADEELRMRVRTDANTFRLQQQFMTAHGAPKGELTTLVTTPVDGGVFLCNRRKQ